MRAGRDHFKDGNNETYEAEARTAEDSAELNAPLSEESDPAPKGIADYTKYPREFITYKWYRPLIVGVLFVVFYVLLSAVLMTAMGIAIGQKMTSVLEALQGGYDTIDVYTAPGAVMQLGGNAIMIPSLWLANLAAGRRTFKSYESSRGSGWDFGIFFKCLLVALIVVFLPIIVDYFITTRGEEHICRFTTSGIICLLLLGPMQCIAEEYVFRAYGMQMIGAWFRVPALAIILPTVAFAAMHPYDAIGVASVAISGLLFGVNAWIGRGIEVSSALHICNNMPVFLMTGFGYGQISSDSTIGGLIFSLCTYGVYTIIMIIFRKRGVFDKRKGDDAAKYNAKVQAKRDKKAAKKLTKQA